MMKTLKKAILRRLVIRKHRNGAVKTVELVFRGELTRFMDVEYRSMPEQ